MDNPTSLGEIAPGALWVKESPLRFLGFEVGSRMTVVRLSDGSLFIHSPVKLDDGTRAELDALGAVRFVVSPNKLHHLFMGDYAVAYPEARLFASPGLARRRRDLEFHGELTDVPDDAWAADLDQTIFRGHPWLQEVVFFHRRSGTLLVADILQNFHAESPFLTRLYARVDGLYERPGFPRDFRFTLTDRSAARRSVERILGWQFQRIVLAHGRVVHAEGKGALEQAFGWLLR